VVEKYLAVRKPVARPSTYRQLDRYLSGYFPSLDGMPIDAVKRRDVALAIADIVAAHGPVAAARARAALSAFYTWALKEGVATGESNPVTFTNDPADEKPRKRVLAPSEIRAIWRTLPEGTYSDVVRLLFYTGCRRQEIGSLEWREINFEKRFS
jgi:integrase